MKPERVMSAVEVTVKLGSRIVLREATLETRAGELVGLIGPNGAGKTTLLRTILGLVPLASGTVRFHGDSMSAEGRSTIGYVPQRHEFAWEFPVNVGQAVMTGLTRRIGLFRRPGAAQWDAVYDALERVRMMELVDRPVGQLSGGQRQRVLVARALALRSQLLLLDEPFTGLDMPAQELLLELFADLAAEGHAVLMTTHDIGSALYTCDRIALLNRTVIASGPPARIAADRALWTRAFGVGDDSAFLRVLKAV